MTDFGSIFRSAIHRSPLVNNAYCLPFPGSDRSVVMRSQRVLYELDKKRPVQMKAYVAFRFVTLTNEIRTKQNMFFNDFIV